MTRGDSRDKPRERYRRPEDDKPGLFARLGVHAGFLLLRLLPGRVKDSLARRVGPKLLDKRWRRRQIVEANLETAFPEKSAEDRESLKREFAFRFLRIALDLGKVWWGSRRSLLANTVFEGDEIVDRLLAENRPVILLGPHTIGLDIGGLALSCRFPILGLTSEPKSGLADWAFLRLRQRYCDEVIDRTYSVRKMIRGVQSGRVLFYLPDEDHGHLKKSVFVPFFGRDTATLLGAGRLLALANAEVCPFTTVWNAETGKYHVRIFEPVQGMATSDPVENCRVMREQLERLIRIQPEDYLWTLRIFNNEKNGRANPKYPPPTIPLRPDDPNYADDPS
ncbi:MAG: lysophospholipid acyltransferase family protein [Gammaproteobacteria bacterium]|nr:lysophospholipid acyltransferase family protein [Gammaproteobacteria bacterium]